MTLKKKIKDCVVARVIHLQKKKCKNSMTNVSYFEIKIENPTAENLLLVFREIDKKQA